MADSFIPEDDFNIPVEEAPTSGTWPERAASEEAFYTAGIVDDSEVVDNFMTTKSNLMVAGQDELSTSVRTSKADDYNTATGNVLADIVLDPLLSDTEKQVGIESLSNTTPSDIDLAAEYELDQASKDEDSLAWQWLDERESLDAEVARIANEELERVDKATGVFGMATDFVGQVLPFAIRETYVDVGRAVLGEGFDITDSTTTMKSKIKDAIRNAPPEEVVPLVRQTLKTIDDNAGLLNSNSFIKKELITEIFNEYLTSDNPEDFDLNGVMTDAFDILDVIGLGQVAKWSIKGTGKVLGSPIRSTMRSNPAKAEKLMASVLDDESGRIAKELGLTKSDVMEVMLAKPDFLKVGLDDIATSKILARGQEIQDEVIALARQDVGQFSKAERSTVTQKFVDQLENIQGARLHQPATTMKVVEDESGVVVKAIYANGSSKPFKTGQEALEQGEKLFGKGAHLKVVRANTTTKAAEEVSKTSIKKEAAKQTLSEDARKQLVDEIASVRADLRTARVEPSPDPVLIGKLETRAKAIDKTLKADNVSQTAGKELEAAERSPGYYFQVVDRRGFVTQNTKTSMLHLNPDSISLQGIGKSDLLSSTTSRFADDIAAPGMRAFDVSNAVQAKLFQIINQPFVKLPRKAKAKIVDKLAEGARNEETFNRSTLLALGWTEDEVVGYQAVRQLMDTLYLLNNDRLYLSLTKQKMSTVKSLSGEYQAVGRMATADELADIKNVYDPSTGSIIPFDEALRESGEKIGRLMGGERVNDEVTNFFIMRGDTELEALTRYPLRYNKGYMTRYYKDNYFIVSLSDNVTVNGVVPKGGYQETVHAVSSIKERDELLAGLNADAPAGVKYDWKHDRRLMSQSREALEEAEWQLNASQGKLFFSPRGAQLGHEKLRSITEVAEIEDPIESMIKTIRTTSNKASHDDLIDSLKARFMNSYRDITPGGRYPASKQLIANTGGKQTDQRVDEARALFDHINMLEGMDNTAMQTWWRESMLRLGEAIQGKFSSRLGQFIGRKVVERGSKDPASMVRGITFNTLIAANPLRQIPLQTQQVFLLSGVNPKYIFNPNGMLKHHAGLTTGWFTRNRPGAWEETLKHVPQAMGMSKSEYTKLVDNWINSGLPYSIDSNVLAKDAYISASKRLGKDKVAALGVGAGNALTAPLRWAKKVGFDVGEYNNLSFTWLTSRDKWIKNNPGKEWTSKKALDAISVESRNLSLSMINADKYGYQKGWLGVATQFFSVQHKAWALMLPKKIGGNRLVDAATKRNMFMGQLAFYGIGGLGLQSAYEAVVADLQLEIPEFAEDVLVGGMGETVINYGLSAATGEDVDLDISRDFSAMAGMYDNLLGLIESGLKGEVTLLEALSGPSATAFGRFGDAINMTAGLMQRHDLTNTEILKRIVTKGPMIFSGYSNYVKARAMMNLQAHVDKYGDPLTKELYASQADAYAKLFGIRSTKEVDYWNSIIEMGNLKKSFKEDAKFVFDQVKRNVDAGEASNNPDKKLVQEGLELEGMILTMFDDEEYRDAIHQEVAIMLRRDANNLGRSSVSNRLAGLVNGGQADKNQLQTMIEKASNRGQLTDEHKRDMKKFIDYMSKFDAKVQ